MKKLTETEKLQNRIKKLEKEVRSLKRKLDHAETKVSYWKYQAKGDGNETTRNTL